MRINKRYVIYYIIIASTIIRCIIAANVGLDNDEVYYWTYALHLQTSYFDHPPLIALFIRLFTVNLNFNQEIFVRLTAIIGSALNTWLIYKMLCSIRNRQAGIYAASLYTACVYTSIISGLFILPDSPLPVLITLILISPIIYWNYQNNYITYTYHSQRVTRELISLLLLRN